MASSSSPMTPPNWKYDVFLSFRGADVRNSFTSHLYDALCRNKIDTYIDYKLGGGETIDPALLERIEQSYISVVIFSDNYADSTFCLNELSKILECKEKKGQMVLPVFYRVDPSHVQELSGRFGDALSKHKQECSSRKLKRWRHALKEIANLKGWDSKVTKPETRLIREIVDDIQKKLEHMPLSGLLPTISKTFVGITSRVNDIESLLSFESSNVLIVGIWGIGGVGKSTAAELVYHRNFPRFDGYCFFRNVREESQKHGLVHVRQEILRKVLKTKDLSVSTKVLESNIKRRLQRTKVLVVLDDVVNPWDLKNLVGEEGLFGNGSRIIVTSRDRQVLINQCEEDKIYEVKDLDQHDALQLFSLHAFKQNYPIEEYVKLSEKVLSYVKGIPLVLEILGCNLYKRSVDDWESKLVQLQKHGDQDILKTLETCYHDLDETAKKIFLDIACFFGIYNKDIVQQALDPEERVGISRLTDMCLIKIINSDIWMHDDLQHLGKAIVRREKADDPGKGIRLWEPEDVCDVITNHQGIKKVEAISLHDWPANIEMSLSPTAFEGMNKLRLLQWYPTINRPGVPIYLPYDEFPDDFQYELQYEYPIINFPGGLKSLSNDLRILKWYRCPLKSLPSNFCPKKLVELEMEESWLEKLWDEYPLLMNLKLMNLRNSKRLRLLDEGFSKFPNLKDLNLGGHSLMKLPASIRYCTKLTGLQLYCCEYLYQLPSSIGNLSQLVELDLCYCRRLESLPDSIGELKCLAKLNLRSCDELTSLPDSIGKLKSLEDLNLCYCSKLACLPNSIYDLESLEMLDVSLCKMLNGFPENRCSPGTEEIPVNIEPFPKLTRLSVAHSESLRYLPELPSSLQSLDASLCYSLKSIAGILTRGKEACSEDFGFRFCVSMDQKSRNKILRDTRLRIQRMAISLFNQGHGGVDDSGKIIKFRLYIPGSVVPKWFMYKNNQGSSIEKIKPAAHWYGCSNTNNFLGFAFSAVVRFDHFSHGYNCGFLASGDIRCECRLITKGGTRDLHFNYLRYIEEPMVLDSVHVFVWYEHGWSGISSNGFFDEASFHFYPVCGSERERKAKGFFEFHKHCSVLKCGVHPLFAQDE